MRLSQTLWSIRERETNPAPTPGAIASSRGRAALPAGSTTLPSDAETKVSVCAKGWSSGQGPGVTHHGSNEDPIEPVCKDPRTGNPSIPEFLGAPPSHDRVPSQAYGCTKYLEALIRYGQHDRILGIYGAKISTVAKILGRALLGTSHRCLETQLNQQGAKGSDPPVKTHRGS